MTFCLFLAFQLLAFVRSLFLISPFHHEHISLKLTNERNVQKEKVSVDDILRMNCAAIRNKYNLVIEIDKR